jgi:hypothetical protein
MSSFFKLNSNKIKFAVAITVISFLSLELIVFLVAYAKGVTPDGNLIAAILFVSIFLAPVFIIGISYCIWTFNRAKRNRIFSKAPFNALHSIGFHTTFKNEATKWLFTEEILKGEIDGFTMHCDFSEQKNASIEFEVVNVYRQIDKSAYTRLEKLFATDNIYFKFNSIAKSYSIKQARLLTVEDLKGDLLQFTTLLKNEGFEKSH